MVTQFEQLEKFVINQFKPKLKNLDVKTDWIISTIFFNNKYFEIRIEGDENLNGKFKWRLIYSNELN